MKTTSILRALLTVLFAGPASANLLSNAGFQLGSDGTTNASEAAAHWSTWGETSRENWGSKDTDGWLATLHGWNGVSTGGWRQTVSANPQTAYLLSGYACAEEAYTCRQVLVKLDFADAAMNLIHAATSSLSGVGEEWSQWELAGLSPSNTSWVSVSVEAAGQGSSGSFKMDALRLSTRAPPPPPPPPNLLSNASFQFGPDGTTNAHVSAMYWTCWGEASRENWGSKDADLWLGSIHGWNGLTNGGWRQVVGATPQTKYLLSGYFCADTGYAFRHMQVKLEFADAAMNPLGAASAVVSGVGTDWTYYEVEGLSPSQTAWVAAVVTAEGGGAHAAFKFDALHLSTRATPPRARLEPAYGVLSGVSPAWNNDTVRPFNERLGWDHVCFVDFAEFPNAEGYDHLDGHIRQVRTAGGIYVVTLEPQHGLGVISNAECEVFANWCADWNSQGVPVMVRFGHEMNGDWYPWSMQPALYRATFRLLAKALHHAATNTAMLWTPNDAAGYPFGTYNGMTRTAYTNGSGSLEDWCLLDSNGDGVLANDGQLKDDPYAPFYPGDTYVDWVGMTVYHWGTVYPWWYNSLPEARKFSDSLTGNYNGPNGNNLWCPDFYTDWAEGHRKPLMIPETSAFYRPGAPPPPDPEHPPFQTNDEGAIKQRWLEQVFNIGGDNSNALDVAVHFPRLRAVCWFNDYKIEGEAQNDWVNWTVTSNATVADEYVGRLRSAGSNRRYFLNASDLKGQTYGWNYSLDGWTHGGGPFHTSLSTQQAHEGRACLRVDYTNNALPYGVIVAARYGALADPLNTWSNGNAIHVWARVPPGPDWVTVRLNLQSEQGGWDSLPFVSCPPDGAWHQLVVPYQQDRHASSSWLNAYLQLDLPTNLPSTVFFDAFKVVVDSNTNGLAADEDPDDDSDGLPDAWERAWFNGLANTAPGDYNQDTLSNLQHFQEGTDPTDPDTDRDGTPNAEEQVAGTSPTDPNSQFMASSFSTLQDSDRVVLTWTTVTGRWYDVDSTTNLLADQAWVGIATNVPGMAGTRSITNALLAGQGMYRIIVRP